ncbi:SDR family NAD(P)-dependent oxidoreductase [Xanthomonas maliensis]|uniref:SDR family NAD(P)-dependent oxidoreductase n=1 Tax=Xanthomonas maliensis TaxID=1321368 RepID=UPI0003B6B204|nr:SDR family NAD(P)-dependent oxidoreductase [Xanthomonas maliensis]KAB7763460.1 aklaviketone reductase [Xanthomonas maliensis]
MSGMVQSETVVIGGSGRVGAGVVAALLEAQLPVLAVGRDAARLEALRTRHGDSPLLDTLQASVADDVRAQALAAALAQRARPLGAVVASLGSPRTPGRVLDRPVAALRRRLERDLLPHLAAARHLMPLLAEADRGGRYLLVGNPCALRAWSALGDVSVAAAATRMLAQVLHEEAKPLGVRLHLLSVEQPVCTTSQDACPEWIRAVDVGRAAVSLLTGTGQPGQAIVTVSRPSASAPSAGRLAGLQFPLTTREISP